MSWDKLLIIVVAFLYSCVVVNAQSPGGFIAGQKLTAAEPNSAFSAKRDYPVITQLPGKRRPTTPFVQQAISSGGLVGTFTNVKTFGATGNGTTDDCAAITAAMSALKSARGGTLYFPPGTYNEASCGMFIPNNVVVQGAGIDATVIKAASNPCAINMAMTMTGADSSQWAAQNTTYAIKTPTLGGTTVTMTTAANARNFSAGSIILISGDLHGTSFWYPGWFTTVVNANATTGVITLAETLPLGGSQLTTVQKIISMPQQITIRDMTLVGSIGGSLCIFGGDHILVENVKSLPGPGPGIMVMGIVRHSGFKNCRMEQGAQPIELFVASESYIEGCWLYNSGILVDGGSSDCAVINNTIKDPIFSGTPGNAIAVYDYTTRTRVIGNMVTGLYAGGYAGISTAGAPDVFRNNAIMGNTIVGQTTSGATIGISANNGTIVGNVLVNLNTGIFSDAGSDNVIIEGNSFDTVANPLSNSGQIGAAGWRFQQAPGIKSMASGTATPSATGGGLWILYQTGAQSVSNFTSAQVGDEITVIFGDSNTTIQNGTIVLRGAANYNPPANTVMSFVFQGSVWFEKSRSQ